MTIPVAFFLLATATCAAVIRQPRWPVKLALIVVVPCFAFAVNHALNTYDGWPTKSTKPTTGVLVGSYVDEPHWIYLWLIPTRKESFSFEKRNDGETPRAYKVPYTRALHEQLEQTKQRAHGRGIGVQTQGGQRTEPRFYVLPPAKPPAKN